MEQAADEASGQGGEARPGGREPAGADWRGAECRSQAIWFVALEAVRQANFILRSPPPPFGLDDLRCLEGEIDKCVKVLRDVRWADLDFEPRTPAEVQDDLRTVIGNVAGIIADPDRQRGIASAEGRGASEYARWWTETSELVREVRAVIPRTRQHEALAAAKSGRDRGLGKLLGKTPAPPVNTSPSGRLQTLLAAVRDRLGDQEPVLWIADQEGPLQFGVKSLAEQEVKESCIDPPVEMTTRHDCLEWLIAACATLRYVSTEGGGRQSCSPKMFQAWRSGLVEKACRLLGTTCREGPDPRVAETPPPHWDVHVVRDSPAEVLARPLFVAGPGEPRLLAKGVVIVPRAAELVRRLQAWCREPTGAPGDRALMAAVEEISRHEWGSKLSESLQKVARPGFVTIDALRAFVRLLLIMETDGSADDSAAGSWPLGPPEEFRLVAKLEGLVIQPGGLGARRRIPCRQVPRRDAVAGAALALRLPDGQLLPIGVPSEPAACEAEIFAAIDDLDWRLWAIEAAATCPTLQLAKDDREHLRRLLRKAGHDVWEGLKTGLLRSDRDPAMLAKAIPGLVVARLRLEHSLTPDDDLSKALIDDYRRLERALLGRLHDLDPNGLGGLHPPRSRDGGVDVFRWRAASLLGTGRSAWEIRWQVDQAPFGAQLRERITPKKTIGVTFSASPRATEQDIHLLEAPFVSTGPWDLAGTCFEPLARFGREILSPEGHFEGMPDMAAALMRLRDAFAGLDRAAFDGLIKAATSSPADPDAVRWIGLLQGDPRFAFDCQPPITETQADGEAGFAIKPPSVSDELVWKDSDTVAEGDDLRVMHSLVRQHGLRVLSRGRPAEGSAEHLAAECDAVCRAALPTLLPFTDRIGEKIDRLRTFPAERAGLMPFLAEAIAAALDELVHLAEPAPIGGSPVEASEDALAGAFGLLARIAALHGHRVTPEAWHPRTGTPVSGVSAAGDLAAMFHPTTAAGDWIVDRFGVEGDHGRAGRCRRSAGPAPAGYEPLRMLAQGLPSDEPRCGELRQGLSDLPGHVLEEKARLAIPRIYDNVWNVLVEHSATAGDPAPWKAAVAELIRKPYDMVMFEPTKLGEYPSSWIVEAGGHSPRGRHIVRVVRPGVRTLEKKLVWPAVVETE